MRAFIRALLATAMMFAVPPAAALADTWIDAVTPRIVGRGATAEIVIRPWRHEATDVVFYPPATFAPVAFR